MKREIYFWILLIVVYTPRRRCTSGIFYQQPISMELRDERLGGGLGLYPVPERAACRYRSYNNGGGPITN